MTWFTLTNNFFFFFFFLKCIEFPSPKPTESTTVSCNPLSFHFFCFFTSTHFAYSCNSLVFYYKFMYLFFFTLFFTFIHFALKSCHLLLDWLLSFYFQVSVPKLKRETDTCWEINEEDEGVVETKAGETKEKKKKCIRSRDKYKEDEKKPR